MNQDNPFGDGPFADGAPINPYSPSQTDGSTTSGAPGELSDVTSRGMVGQVQILGVLMIVQGVFVSLMGIAIGGYAALMPQFLQQIQQQAAGQGGNAPSMPPNMGLWFGIVGGLMGLLTLAIGVLTVIAGVRTMKFRGRVFSMIMICTGLLTVLTCYCLPTQIALSIYGLLVLLNPPVRDAFRFAEQGHSALEIQRAYLSLP